MTGNHQKDKKKQKKNKKKKQANKPETKKNKKNKKKKKQAKKPETKQKKENTKKTKKTMGITRPKANKPMSKRRRTKYNDKNFHVQYFITAPKQQSNNAKECQHQNNVAGGLGTLLHCLIAALEL